MAKTRKYNVKGTKDFIVLAIFFAFLGLWAVKDGWYPSPKMQERHPRIFELVAPADGIVQKVLIEVDSRVTTPYEGHEPTLVFELSNAALQKEYDDAKARYAELRNGSEEKAAMELEHINELKDQLDALMIYCPSIGKEKNGRVLELKVNHYDHVSAGDVMAVVLPNHNFYIFNKSLTVVSGVLFVLFLLIHLFAR